MTKQINFEKLKNYRGLILNQGRCFLVYLLFIFNGIHKPVSFLVCGFLVYFLPSTFPYFEKLKNYRGLILNQGRCFLVYFLPSTFPYISVYRYIYNAVASINVARGLILSERCPSLVLIFPYILAYD